MIRKLFSAIALIATLTVIAPAKAGIIISMTGPPVANGIGDQSAGWNYSVTNNTLYTFNAVTFFDNDLQIATQSADVSTGWSHNALDHTSGLTRTFSVVTFADNPLIAGLAVLAPGQTLQFGRDVYFDPDANPATDNAVGGNFNELLFGTQFEFQSTLGDTFVFTSDSFNTNLAGTQATFNIAAVPEPGSFVLLGCSAIGGLFLRLRPGKKSQKQLATS
jgi:hypothetical protein